MIVSCINLQLPIVILKKSIFLDMHHHETYMYINFQQSRVSRSCFKTVHTNLIAKNCKLHKFATCNYNFEKLHFSDMHYPLMDIQADFEINRPIRYLIAAKRNYFHRRQTETDRRTDGQTLRTTTIGSFFFEERKKPLKSKLIM